MPQQRNRQRKRDQDKARGSTQEQSKEKSSTQIQAKTEKEQYYKFAQWFMRTMGSAPKDTEKKYGIEQLKNL